MRYLVRIYGCKNSYSALLPDLPGCVAVEESVEKVKKLIAEAAGLHLELMRESGEKIPPPSRQLKFAIDDSEEEEYCTWIEVEEPKPVVVRTATRKRKETPVRTTKKAI
jgi:predicted RNase H-like HicB family nuclease